MYIFELNNGFVIIMTILSFSRSVQGNRTFCYIKHYHGVKDCDGNINRSISQPYNYYVVDFFSSVELAVHQLKKKILKGFDAQN